MKITSRCGTDAIDGLNNALLAKAHGDKLIRLDKVRADTTVVEANVAYPTDSGLLAKGVAKLGRLAAQVKAAGLATTTFRDRTRSGARRARDDIGAWLRRRNDDAKAEVRKINAEMAGIAERTVADARHVAANARGLRTAKLQATGKTVALIAELERTATIVERIAAQTRVRLSGETPDGSTADRVAARSRCSPDRQGPTRSSRRVRLQGPSSRQRRRHRGRPQPPCRQPARRPDARTRHRSGHRPVRSGAARAVTADRGYGEAAIDRDLEDLGVIRVVIPRKGRPVPPANTRSEHDRSASWSSGAPAAKPASPA